MTEEGGTPDRSQWYGNLGYVRDGELFGGIEGWKSQWGVKAGYTPQSDCHIVTR